MGKGRAKTAESLVAARNFGNTLRFYRNRAGLSQGALAAKVNLDTSTIAKLELGDRHPTFTPQFFQQFVEPLGLSFAEVTAWIRRWLEDLGILDRDGDIHVEHDADDLSIVHGRAEVGPAIIEFTIASVPGLETPEQHDALTAVLSASVTERLTQQAIHEANVSRRLDELFVGT